MSVFPTLAHKPDSSKYTRTKEDPAITSKMDGGYVYSRPRFTRAPRKSWKITYTEIVEADRVLLDDFYDTVRGGSDYFTWTDPEDNAPYTVRFKGELKFAYKGIGSLKFWNVSFDLEQV